MVVVASFGLLVLMAGGAALALGPAALPMVAGLTESVATIALGVGGAMGGASAGDRGRILSNGIAEGIYDLAVMIVCAAALGAVVCVGVVVARVWRGRLEPGVR